MRTVQYDRYGPPEVLHVAEEPAPSVGTRDVLVRVAATTVNHGDVTTRAGKASILTGRRFPKHTSIDFVGEVVGFGGEVTSYRSGDHVWGLLPRSQFLTGKAGAASELVASGEATMSRAPESLDPVESVATFIGFTPLISLRDQTKLRAGDRLLVRGATGGTGSLAVQIGKALGAEVTALAREELRELAVSLGADHVYDYRTTAPADLGRFDVVFDAVGSDLADYRRLLSPQGRMITIAPSADHPFSTVLVLTAAAVHGRRRIRLFRSAPSTAVIADLAEMVDRGDVRPVIDTVHPIEHTADAHRAVEAGGVRGKHVIRIP